MFIASACLPKVFFFSKKSRGALRLSHPGGTNGGKTMGAADSNLFGKCAASASSGLRNWAALSRVLFINYDTIISSPFATLAAHFVSHRGRCEAAAGSSVERLSGSA
jgi:hypothetical protein